MVSLEDPHNVGINNDEAKCTECHHLENTINIADGTIKEISPTNIVTQGDGDGGPDCVSCHDIGGSAPAHVNVTAMNDNNEIHKNLNSGARASNPTAYYANNKRCWACHANENGNGSEPLSNNHPSNYKTPRRCADCHLPLFMGGDNHNQFPNPDYSGCTVCHFNIPLYLRAHFSNGINILTPNATTCYDCHNKTEMLVYANDPDTGSVYGGVNGGNNSPSHYGLKRNDMRIGGNANCSYCHQNTSTVFAEEMIDPTRNSTIANHSLSYNSSNPACADSRCHGTGLIHGNSRTKMLTKPSLTLPISSYCTSCHGSSGSATIKNLAKHNGTVDCTKCHLSTARDIHPVKYLQPDASYNTGNSTAVNCINCHQTGLAGFQTAAMVPNPMHHSDNVFNGSIWNNYWTSPKGACIYCHNDTKHSVIPLGRILQFAPGYRMYGSIGTNTSCSNCHYKGDSNYSQMITTFTSSILNIPPEITNGTNWKGRSSNYYNHSIPSYQDKDCKACHGSLLSSGANMSEFQHNVGGGDNCIYCHVPDDVNTSIFARHANMDTTDGGLNNVTNSDCWTCHYQKDMDRSNVYLCESCHINSTGIVTVTDPALIESNFMHKQDITTCRTCHAPAKPPNVPAYHLNATVGPLGLVERILGKMR
ncbi:MAG: hypothetical protein KKG76_02780 [Euryarchaeota archaeon]|nr:hypothetical protein [Euryarchaeota archaeon]